MVLDLSDVADELIDDRTKGVPLGVAPFRLGDIGSPKWNVMSEDLPLPLLVCKRSVLDNNLATMAAFCARHGVELAPHGKTTMAPQLFDRQLEAGAWGITCASVEQLAVYRRFGVPRVMLANQVVGQPALSYITRQLRDDELDLSVFVDSVEGVGALDRALGHHRPRRSLDVLVEVGYPGGRAGVRSFAEAVSVGRAVSESGHLRLAGVGAFEGLLPVQRSATSDRTGADATLDGFLQTVAQTVEGLRVQGLLPDEFIVTAGGSAAFDRVVAILGSQGGTLVLRSGCYVTHDHGMYADTSPLAADGPHDAWVGHLEPALELWTYVQSRPEPGLVIVSAGRRDAPFDSGLPVPIRHVVGDGRVGEDVSRWSTMAMNDQHCYVHVPPDTVVGVGDRVVFGISHPCTAFDKWRIVPVIDEETTIVDGIRTYF